MKVGKDLFQIPNSKFHAVNYSGSDKQYNPMYNEKVLCTNNRLKYSVNRSFPVLSAGRMALIRCCLFSHGAVRLLVATYSLLLVNFYRFNGSFFLPGTNIRYC